MSVNTTATGLTVDMTIPQNQTISESQPHPCAAWLIALVASWIVTAILLILTIGMAIYIFKTRRRDRLPLTAVKAVGVRLPAYDRRTGGGRGDDARRQPNGVKTRPSAKDEASPPAAATYRVDLHDGGSVDGITFDDEKQPTGVEQPCGGKRARTEGDEGLTLPANAVSAASASPAPGRRTADLQLGASASPAALRPSAPCAPSYGAPVAAARAGSPFRSQEPPPSPLAASPVRGLAPPPSPLAFLVPVSPTASATAASSPRPVARAAATLERIQPRSPISARQGGNGADRNVGAGRKNSADSSSDSDSTNTSSSSVGLTGCSKGAIGVQAHYTGSSRCNVASGAAGSTVAEQASRAVPAAASAAYAKTTPLAAPAVRRMSSRFRAAAEPRRLSDSLLDERRRDSRRSNACDDDASMYIAVLPSPPPLTSAPSHDGDDYENAGPVNAALSKYIQRPAPLPRGSANGSGREVAEAGAQRPALFPALRRQRRRSLESCIEDYDYCNENSAWELFRLRRQT